MKSRLNLQYLVDIVKEFNLLLQLSMSKLTIDTIKTLLLSNCKDDKIDFE